MEYKKKETSGGKESSFSLRLVYVYAFNGQAIVFSMILQLTAKTKKSERLVRLSVGWPVSLLPFTDERVVCIFAYLPAGTQYSLRINNRGNRELVYR